MLVQTLDVDIPSDETDLIEAGMIDSLAVVELLFALEEEFSVTILLDTLDVDDLRSVRRIGQLVAALEGASA